MDAPEVNFDNPLATDPPETPVSALVFELFPPTAISTIPSAVAIAGGVAAPAAGVSASAAFNAPLAAVRSSSVPSLPVTQPWQMPISEITEPSELNLQMAIETFPSTSIFTTVTQTPVATPPLLPGAVIVPERFPEGNSPDSGFNGFAASNPGQFTTSTTSTSRQLLGATAAPGPESPGEDPDSPGGNPNLPDPGANTVPEPVAGVLVCAGLACLCLVAKRFGPSSPK
jgi:hypothetical protein